MRKSKGTVTWTQAENHAGRVSSLAFPCQLSTMPGTRPPHTCSTSPVQNGCPAQTPSSCHTQPFCPTHCVFTPDNCTALHSAAIASQPLWNPIRNADFSFAGDLPLAGPSSAEQRPLRQEPWPLATALGPYPHQPSPFHKEGELEEPGWTRGHLPQVAILLSVLLLRGRQAGGTEGAVWACLGDCSQKWQHPSNFSIQLLNMLLFVIWYTNNSHPRQC